MKVFWVSIEIIMCFFVFGFVYVVGYVYRFVDVDPALHHWDEAYLIMMEKFFDVLLQSVCQYFLEDFYIYVYHGHWPEVFFFLLNLCQDLVSGLCWSHKMIWEGFPLFVLFGIVLEGVVPAPLCTSGRIWL